MEKLNDKTKDVFGLWITKHSKYAGKFDFPVVSGNLLNEVDFIATYSEKSLYHKTSHTLVCFCVDDFKFDGWNKLYFAIIYQSQSILNKFKQRFCNVKYMAAPDYSVYSDMPVYMQIENIARSRVVHLWLELECNIRCIPTMAWGGVESLKWCFDGIEKGSTVFLSLKGACQQKEAKNNCLAGIKAMIDVVKPNRIIVYSSSVYQSKILLRPAYIAGIRVDMPSNTLLDRNREHINHD